MRRVAEPDRIQHFMTALAVKATRQARLYFTGGATAVLLGWRASILVGTAHRVGEKFSLVTQPNQGDRANYRGTLR